jgi:hypothetical protein
MDKNAENLKIEIINTIKLLLYKENKRFFENFDYNDDDIYLGPYFVFIF